MSINSFIDCKSKIDNQLEETLDNNFIFNDPKFIILYAIYKREPYQCSLPFMIQKLCGNYIYINKANSFDVL